MKMLNELHAFHTSIDYFGKHFYWNFVNEVDFKTSF